MRSMTETTVEKLAFQFSDMLPDEALTAGDSAANTREDDWNDEIRVLVREPSTPPGNTATDEVQAWEALARNARDQWSDENPF